MILAFEVSISMDDNTTFAMVVAIGCVTWLTARWIDRGRRL